MKKFTVVLKSGDKIDAIEAGDPSGKPVFFLHGTPGSRDLFQPQIENAEKLGIRIISYSRPGYGNSTRSKGRQVKDAASDVEDLANFLGIDKFAIWGHSGGGPHSLACAALLTNRVSAAATLASLAPYSAEGLDFYSGMGEFNVEDFKLLQMNKIQWEEKNIEEVGSMMSEGEEAAMQVFSSLLSDIDRESFSKPVLDYLLEGMREGCSKGVKGLMDDNLAFLRPWGFDLASIKVPFQIWHGKKDQFVPFQHGIWLSGKVPGAEKHLFEEEGHISLFVKKNYEIQKWLSDKS